jgi:hypothetical protein
MKQNADPQTRRPALADSAGIHLGLNACYPQGVSICSLRRTAIHLSAIRLLVHDENLDHFKNFFNQRSFRIALDNFGLMENKAHPRDTRSLQAGGALTSAVLDSSGVADCAQPVLLRASNGICR